MRLLITIAHYFKTESGPDWHHVVGSGRAPLAKIAALNSQIVALHRYFGPRRLARDARAASVDVAERNTLDIVVMTVRGANVLDHIGIDPSEYAVEYFDGPPLMLAFEAQRIMRERAGAYDFYGYMEDDLSVTDPAFFDKLGWFAAQFGPDKMLVPARYEMSHTGTLAKLTIEPRLSGDTVKALRRTGLPPTLSGRWNGKEQSFHLPNNPHGGCYFLTDAQLKHWMAQPSFYDRDASWVDPLVSAATYAPGRVFGLYRPGEPDPWFLEIEHFGTFYASMAAQPRQTFGEPPLLALAENAMRQGGAGDAQPSGTINTVMAEALNMRHELESLKRSRTRLAKAFLVASWKKLSGQG